MTPHHDFDLAIAGSGFGGSLLACIARRLGLRVLLVERGSHPRFAIGESTSPLANLVLEQLCEEYDLPALAPLTTWGAWKQAYPGVGCGLKRGFTFYHHQVRQEFHPGADHANELMVAASPTDRVADTHWLRSDVDHFFVGQAIAAGAEYVDHTTIQELDFSGGGVALRARTGDRSWTASAAFLVDATGPRGLLSRALDLPSGAWPFLHDTRSSFSHFEGVPLFFPAAYPGGDPEPGKDYPYPPVWAAVHHTFEGGWIWSLRFDNGITSAGIAARPWLAEELELSTGEPGWQKLLDRFPSLEHFREAEPIRRFDYMPCLPYRCGQVAASRWALLPGAAAFVDPFLSSGIPLTLLGIERLARLLKDGRSPAGLDAVRMADGLAAYERDTLAEVDAMALLVSGCYAAFSHFELLTSYLMYYFAAASYAEVARRLQGREERAGNGCKHEPGTGTLFMRADDPCFQEAIWNSAAALAEWDGPGGATPAPARIVQFQDQVRRDIASINVAGLLDPAKANRYPVDLQDLVRSASLLGRSAEEMEDFIRTLPL